MRPSRSRASPQIMVMPASASSKVRPRVSPVSSLVAATTKGPNLREVVRATPPATPTQIGQRRLCGAGGGGLAVNSEGAAACGVGEGASAGALLTVPSGVGDGDGDDDDDDDDDPAGMADGAVDGSAAGAASSAGGRPPSCTMSARTCARSG